MTSRSATLSHGRNIVGLESEAARNFQVYKFGEREYGDAEE